MVLGFTKMLKERLEIIMLKASDLYEEIEKLELMTDPKEGATKASSNEVQVGILKALVLNLKLLHNIRMNFVQVMDHFNIEKVKSRHDGASTARK